MADESCVKEMQDFSAHLNAKTLDHEDVAPEEKKRKTIEEDGSLLKVMAGGLLGNVLEWYDFSVYAAVATEVGQNFFPEGHKTVQIIAALTIFAGAFVMRPVGGVIFGWIGDTHGRKTALVISVLLMAFSSFLMGILPTYKMIGTTASVLLGILKLLQGLSVGGEMIGSMLFLCEFSPKEKRGFYGSTVLGSAFFGISLGVCVVALLRLMFSPEQMLSFGWRIPFISGVVLAGVAYWVRVSLDEPPDFKEMKEKNELSDNPLKTAIVEHWKLIVLVAGCNIIFTVTSWSLTAFLPYNYLSNDDLVLNTTPHAGAIATTLLFLLVPQILLAGMLSDYLKNRTHVMMVSIFYLGLLWVVAFPMFKHGSMFWTSLTYFGITIGLAGCVGPLSAWLCEIFPSATRFTAVALGYNMAQATFGGTAPLVLTAITQVDSTESNFFLGVYCAICAAISFSFFCCVLHMKQKQKKSSLVESG
mmetsp:Transcript_12063/g.16031  ORF Transcript_12063/g.16031 Transcript_12063/m.16031 type:complete len:473 (-) Transcript_12063:45-1463(-)|eukprot:CAMPEP_0201489954 /NCGR_PEP_ID=MMETSP0151_2-20130828/24341_1 /ASSEMBLY_ACC=CAM_ASM_000257 /TAXON_ID=200890 /ORGANISM="Paramoeba atlantica, Strain 621/1 / CCAP 1560/9" /LENGTH=472 /DNA_ID=CAMNT_0047875707 /DNA_START=130 /DNA_END=1548 /DNA_ORIENTATION=-